MDHRGADDATRFAGKVAAATDGAAKHAVVLDGDQFTFDANVPAHANANQVSDVIDGTHVQQAMDDAVATLQAHLPADIVADAGDAAQAAVAKILAQIAAHSGHHNTDLV